MKKKKKKKMTIMMVFQFSFQHYNLRVEYPVTKPNRNNTMPYKHAQTQTMTKENLAS